MYYETFGLKEPPFQLTPDSRYLFFSHVHKRAKAYMDYAVWKRDGFIVLTGEIGAGKTTLINKLLSEINDDVEVVRIFQTQLNEIEFLQAMLFELGVSNSEIHGQGKVELLHRLNAYLVNTYSQGKHVVLIIDEGQNLTTKVLEEIRMLSGLELDKEKLLNIILVGQPEMNDILDQPNMMQLVQRIRLRFHLGPLKDMETIEYIKHRLTVAGSTSADTIFSEDSYEIIQKYTGGIPRKLNVLCDTALVCAFADGKQKVDASTIEDAVAELQWNEEGKFEFESTYIKHSGLDNNIPVHDGTNAHLSNDMPSNTGAPSITIRDQQWGDMFSSVLKIMGNVTESIQSIESQIVKINNRLDELEPVKKDNKILSLPNKNNNRGS